MGKNAWYACLKHIIFLAKYVKFKDCTNLKLSQRKRKSNKKINKIQIKSLNVLFENALNFTI
jgi:hypothetical protein